MINALKREGRSAASHAVLAEHAERAAKSRSPQERHEAAIKAVQTKGPQELREEARKAAETRAQNA
jgi:hypothetical protein